MTTTVAIVTVAVVGYLLGSIPFAATVARRHGIDDLRRVGDHNPGFWNASELLGARAAAPVFTGDALKGAVAALLGVLLADAGQWWLAYVGAGAAMVGHAWPVFAGFRGGRSVSTFVGAAAVCAPLAAVSAAGVLVFTWLITRRIEWAIRLGVAAFPVIQIVLEGPTRTAATGALMTFIGVRFMALRLDTGVRAT